MTSPMFTLGFSLGIDSFPATGRILRVTPVGRKKIIGGCSWQEHWAKPLVGRTGHWHGDVLLQFEFEEGFARYSYLLAVGHHLYGGASSRADSCADPGTSATARNPPDQPPPP